MKSRVLAVTAGIALAGALAVFPARAVQGPPNARLAIMVLPQKALGAEETQRFRVDIGSGFADNAAAAEDTLDPSDTGRQLSRAGRIHGYNLSYSDQALPALVRGRGLLSIETSVDLFTSGAKADAFLAKQVRDAQRLRGKLVDGMRVAAASTFSPARIGDHTVGLRTTTMLGDKPVYRSLVGFRLGALVGAVAVDRADARAATVRAERLAQALAARMRLAAQGRLKAQPVAVPPVGRKGQPRPGKIDLAAMALSPRDLSKGTTVVRQGYVDDRTSIASYERELDSTRFGGASIESDISLYRDAREATGALRIMRAMVMSATAERDWADELDEPELDVEQSGPLDVGDEAVALVLRFPAMGLVPTRVALVFVRVGRTTGTLMVAGLAKSFRFADAKPLAATFAQRMHEAL